MTTAIVTDAISAGSYFPAWYRYYSTHILPKNMFVFTYAGGEGQFAQYELGGVNCLPSTYNDDLRKNMITEFVGDLLKTFDLVLRVDVDEFVVPEPRLFRSLADYLDKFEVDYVTPYGFDIIQSVEEPDLNLDQSILSQRRFAYALEAMNKTCLTRIPLKWGRGFHYCSRPPKFGSLFLFHAKRADIKLQHDWNLQMLKGAGSDEFVKEYYSWQLDQIIDYHKKRLFLPVVQGEESLRRPDFERAFLESVHYSEHTGLFEGTYNIEPVNVVIPARFKPIF